MSVVPPAAEQTPVAKRGSRRWLWYFVVLAILGALAIGVNWIYNLGEPLTPEKLQAARKLWQQNRPADYDLKIVFARQTRSTDGFAVTMVDKLAVQVRQGAIVEFLINGKPPEPLVDQTGKRNEAEERAQREHYDISGLFDSIEELMERDRRDGRRCFIRARFDKTDGHVILFTRQFQGKREQHIQVELKRVAPGS